MRTALRGVLAVDEREIALAVARAVGDGYLDVVARKVDRRIERLLGHVFVEQIQQAVFRNVAVAVEIERQPQVQVRIVAHHLLDVFEVVGILAEDLLVDAERDEGAVFLAHAALPLVAHLEPLGEGHRAGLAVAYRTGRELAGKHVDGLDADAVQADGLLEGRAAVLTAGVHLADGRRERFEGDAAAVVAHRHHLVLDRNVDLAAGPHDEFVDRIVHDLLDEDVNAVVGLRAVAQLADIHAGLYGYERKIGADELARFIRLEYGRIGADQNLTPREVIRDFIELLDLLYQNPAMHMDELLQSDDFTYARSEAVSDQTDKNYAEFTI